MNDRSFIFIGLALYLAAFLHSLYLLRERGQWESRAHSVLVVVGWLFHSYGMFLRGRQLGGCPVTNLFETVMFITWALVLVYLLVGLKWRVSLLGSFTLPLVIALCVFAMFPAMDQARSNLTRSVWLSLHATLSLLAYGMWALAGVTGVMYLVQERQLKSHHLRSLCLRLPPIAHLDLINFRLLIAGLILLSAGVALGFVVGLILVKKDVLKAVWTFAIWAIYAGLVMVRMTGRMRGRKIAIGSIVLLVIVLATFWGVNHLSAAHRF